MKLSGVAIILIALITSSAQAASSCPQDIAACGCSITSSGEYKVNAPLQQPGA